MLVLTGLLIGCGVNTNTTQTVNASLSEYKEDDLGRIRLVTYVDKENANRLQFVGMTSQPLNEK